MTAPPITTPALTVNRRGAGFHAVIIIGEQRPPCEARAVLVGGAKHRTRASGTHDGAALTPCTE